MKFKFSNIMLNIKQKIKGFTLIESIVALAVFLILVLTFYKIFSETMIHMQDSKYRRGAVALANERMEQFRNLAYENVGTTDNAPFGNIVADEVVDINGLSYRIITSVFFVDDPIDGTLALGTDNLYQDYKRVGVTIVWDDGIASAVSKSDAADSSEYSNKRINIVSQFVPPGGLETEVTGGVLSINVLDSTVEDTVSLANVDIEIYDNIRSVLTTGIATDSTGNYMYVGAPVCDSCYEITIKKPGYEIRKTMDVFDPSVGDGVKPFEEGEFDSDYVHQSVTLGDITTLTFNTNKTSQLNIKSQDVFGNLIGDIGFDIEGGEILGSVTDDVTNEILDVFGYTASGLNTDSTSADIDLDTAVDGTYVHTGSYLMSNISFPSGHLNDVFWKLQPTYGNNLYEINLDADVEDEVKMVILDNDYDGAFIQIVETVDSELIPVPGVSVQLQNSTITPAYDVTLVTDEFGYVYFPENTTNVTIPGFSDVTIADGATDVLVNGETYNIIIAETDDYDGIDGVSDSEFRVTVDGLVQDVVEIIKK